jgi:hypothetical protein
MAASGTFRGGLQVANTLYGAWAGELYTVNQSGEATLYSTVLASTDNIFIAQNNRATNPHIVIVANSNTAYLVRTTAADISAYSSIDADVGSPTCVGGHMGYIMFGYGNGDIQASDLNDTNLNTLNKARTESNPDGVLNIFSYNGQMFVFGEKTVEVWGDPVNLTGFPLSRVGFNILPGLKAAHAVAGWHPEFGQPPIWVGSDNTVRRLSGYSAEKISTSDLDRLIAAVVFPDTQLEANCWVAGGAAYWQVTCNTGVAATSWSWTYAVDTGKWFESRSYGLTRSAYKRSVPAFGKWLVGDSESSDLLAIDHTATEEAGDPITAVMESGPAKDFPNRQRIARADFDFVPGVGIATSTLDHIVNPTVLIEVSKDGGKTWPVSWVRSLGSQADWQRRIYVLNAGLSGDEGARWRWSISDPVHVGFTGGSMDPAVVTK